MTADKQNHLLSAGLTAVFTFLFLLLLPTQMGGDKSYIILAGNSMEPTFTQGDLVIVRRQLTYAVGDAVQYEHPYINAVFHRIVGRDGEKYVLQGDNNGWLDSTQPTNDQIVGKLWVHIPNAGAWIAKLRSPQTLAMTSTLFSALIVLSFIDLSSLLSPQNGLPGKEKPAMITSDSRPMNRFKETAAKYNPLRWLTTRQISILSYVGMGAAIALYLIVIGFSNPVSYDEIQNIKYTHHGRYAYTALADQDVYDADAIRTGEPIFLRLNDNFDVFFEYTLTSEELHNVTGSYRMLATVSADNGWNRSFELVPSTPLDGPQAIIVGTVDLSEILRQVNIMKEETGLQTNRFSLWVMPVVDIQGDIKGAHIEDQFAQPLEFRFDELQVTLRPDAVLEPSEEEGFLYPATLRGTVTLPLVNWQLDVLWMRIIGVGLMVAMLGTAGALVLIWRAGDGKQPTPETATNQNTPARRPTPQAEIVPPPLKAAAIPPSVSELGSEATPGMDVTQPSQRKAAPATPMLGGEIVERDQMDMAGRRVMHLSSLDELTKLGQTQGQTIFLVRDAAGKHYYMHSGVTDNTYLFEER
jgi:signal peptidase I